MFSSLPSASKIYVSSCKPKHKTLNSAKRKRKKSAASSSTPVRVCDEDTLVSSISLRKGASSQLSMHSNESSVDNEFHSEIKEEILIVSEEVIYEESTTCVEENCAENKSIDPQNETNNSVIISHNDENTKNVNELSEPDKEEIELEKLTSAILDGIYDDESYETDNYETVETQESSDVESSESMLKTVISKSNSLKADESEDTSCVDINSTEGDDKLTSPLMLRSVNTAVQTSEEDKVSNDELLTTVSVRDMSNKENDCKFLKSGQINTNSTNLASNDVNLKCEENEVLPEDSFTHRYEDKDALDEKIPSDNDSSSVRSDICAATNIYDIHVDNSEHGSLEENQISNHPNGRMQSPEQSEVSCTESIMYDAKNICQNESSSHNCSAEDLLYKNHVSSISNHGKTSDISILQHKDSSRSITNLFRTKSEKILLRSLSVPDKICNSRHTELLIDNFAEKILDIHAGNLDKNETSTKFSSTSDKSTFTVEESVNTLEKSTITSNVFSFSQVKKDAATTPIKSVSKMPITEDQHMLNTFKDSTMLMMKVLPPVAVMQARARSYVFGSIGATGSLLGNEELSRYFPDGNVTVFVGTWNMNGHDSPECIDDFLLPLDVSSMPDIYAIGVQESMQSRSEWEILLQTALGPSHVLFASTSFGVLHLCIFMRRDLIWFCSEPEEANIATRPGSMIKTKGAVAICFMFFGTSILFVNSHLTAHEQKLKERLSDYEKICSSLDLPKQIPLKTHQRSKDVTSRFDCVFWCGDLNFRVVQDRPSVLSFVEEKIRKNSPLNNLLMQHDQLTQAMAEGVVFQGFSEGIINFIPSYKFDVGTSSFDSAKQRVPSYTDRILYRSRNKSSIVCLHYNAVSEIFTSDHKPVFAVFKVSIKPGRDNIPLAAGLFKRDIYLEAIKRRSQQLKISRNYKQSTICNVM